MNPTSRLASVDALRGLAVAAMLLVNDPGDWGHVYAPLEHSAWHGCTPTDLVFPFFLFIVGVSIALAFGPRRDAGVAAAALGSAALRRAVRIVGLGLLLNLAAWLAMPDTHLRLPGVLQRIGVCFAAAALLALYARPRAQWAWFAALLAGYALLLWAGGSLQPWINLPSRIDTAVFGRFVYQFDAASGRGHDPEGLASTLPALATTLLGLRAGDWLRRGDVRRMVVAGGAALACGALWSAWLPLNKNLWTPSFVLWSGGFALLALAACHVLVDRRGWPALGRRFGVNAIGAYAGSGFMVYALIACGWSEPLYRYGFARWITPLAGPYVSSLAYAVAFVGVWWLVVYAMDRRGWYLKI